MGRLYRFLKSVRLAVALLLAIALLSVLATLVPQGREEAFYFHRYSPALARLLLALDFDTFFRSWLFLAPCSLFCLNLAVCAADRLARRLRRQAPPRYGPDLIHFGLLVLMAGALLSGLARREAPFRLGAGDAVELAGGYTLRLLDLAYESYPDGRPKDWVSRVQATRGDRVLVESYAIEVNKPLRLPGIKVYQSSFGREEIARLRSPDGKVAVMARGEGFRWKDAVLVFDGLEGELAVFERYENHAKTDELWVGVSMPVGDYTLLEVSSRMVTGLRAVKDPGLAPVIAGLALVAAGLGLSLLQKRKDGER